MTGIHHQGIREQYHEWAYEEDIKDDKEKMMEKSAMARNATDEIAYDTYFSDPTK